MILCSVIIPLYNAEKYISETIKSAQEQSYKNLEIIIIDDCSTDNSYHICESFALNDQRIKLLKNESNIGVSKTRNKGLQIASGEWIAFLDADDIWEKEKIDQQMKYISKTDCKIVFTACGYITENSAPVDYVFYIKEKMNYKLLLKRNLIYCSSTLVKKSFLLKHPMKEGDIHEDYLCWLDILKNEGGFAYGINSPLIKYRLLKNSRSANKLKGIKKQYNLYRIHELSTLESLWGIIRYSIFGFLKHAKIRQSKKQAENRILKTDRNKT